MAFLLGDKPKSPPPLDVTKVAGEQRTENTANVAAQDKENRFDWDTSLGNTGRWTVGPDGRAIQTTALGEQGKQFATGLAGLGNQYIQGAGNFVNNRPDMSSNAAFDRADQFWQQREGPRMEQASSALDAQLANKGFSIGSAGYEQAKDDLARQQGDARAGFLNSAQNQFFNQGITDRNQQMSEFNLLNPGIQYAGQAISQGPTSATPLQIPNVDLTQLYGARQDQLNKNYQAELGSYNAGRGGLASLGGTLGSAAIKAWASDERVKTDIKRVGKLDNGLPVYTYKYIWDNDRTHIGVMAQEAEKVVPESVVEIGGIKHVYYDALSKDI